VDHHLGAGERFTACLVVPEVVLGGVGHPHLGAGLLEHPNGGLPQESGASGHHYVRPVPEAG
jgi:hypothetical protein